MKINKIPEHTGKAHYLSKLTELQRFNIYNYWLSNSNKTLKEIAGKYNVSEPYVSKLITCFMMKKS